MKYLIIHDSADRQGTDILEYLKSLCVGEDEYQFVDLSQAEMEPCTGCFNCWLKTPGICIYKDDAAEITEKEINSDRVLYLGPVTWGSYSPQLKILQDRSLGRVLPFFITRNGETHHPSRYENSPIPLLVGYGEDVSQEEEAVFRATGENLNDNIHKDEGMNTLVIRNPEDYVHFDQFFEGAAS